MTCQGRGGLGIGTTELVAQHFREWRWLCKQKFIWLGLARAIRIY